MIVQIADWIRSSASASFIAMSRRWRADRAAVGRASPVAARARSTLTDAHLARGRAVRRGDGLADRDLGLRQRGSVSIEASVVLVCTACPTCEIVASWRDHLRRVHRLGRVLVLHFRHQQGEEVVVAERIASRRWPTDGGRGCEAESTGEWRGRSWSISFQAAFEVVAGFPLGNISFSSSGNSARSAFIASKLRERSTCPAIALRPAMIARALEAPAAPSRSAARQRRGGGAARRVHQHDLHHEIDLPQRRRRVVRLHDVVFQQERHVVQQLDRRLAVDADDGAVDDRAVRRREA